MNEPVGLTNTNTSLWYNRPFLRLWFAQIVSNAGTAITTIALPLTAVLILGATPIQMGLLGIAGSLPNLLFGLVAGVWVDRMRRQPILIVADWGRAFLLASIPLAAWLGHLTFLHLWIVAFFNGSLTVFFQIASISILPSLVTKSQLVDANSKLSMSDSILTLAGPGVAGGLVQILTAPKAIIVDAISYVFSALALIGLGTSESPSRKHTTIWYEIREGIQELIGTPFLWILTWTSSVGTLAEAVQTTVLILFLASELHYPPSVIGFIFACGGAGSLLGSVCAGFAARHIGIGSAMLLGKTLWATGTLMVALATYTGVTLSFIVIGELLAGMGITIYIVNQVSLRQALTPIHLMGRVTAARRFILFSSAVLGAALGGFLGESIGLLATLFISAVALFIELILIYFSPISKYSEN